MRYVPDYEDFVRRQFTMQLDVNYSRVVRVYAPEWFSRADFADFMKRCSADTSRRLATWHAGGGFTDGSDVFIWYDGPDDFSDPLQRTGCRR
jgi:hypothetical protein